MKSQKKWTLTFITLLSICFLVSVAGCDKHTRYKALTFFFTGVPPVDGTIAAERVSGTSAGEKKGKKPETVIPSIHGPYASEQCYLCHVVEKGKRKKADEYTGGFPRLQDLPSKLLLPKKDLCIDCHIAKAYKSAYVEELWIHGPVSSGLCTVCHHHHLSKADYMLLTEKSIDLCSQCHIGDFITNIDEHTEGKDCLECHNAHVGKDRYLLKKDYVEIY